MMAQGLPSLVAGDFNYIVGSQEKMGGKQFVDSICSREFRNFIGDAGLIDLGYSGPRFTWCNNRQGTARVWEKIDCALAIAD